MKSARIFFVEDDEIISQVIRWRLAKLGHTICGSARNAGDALDMIGKVNPDVVLLDIEIQGELDGIDIGEYLASNTRIPFIYLTSHSEGEKVTRAKKTHPSAYLKKPVDDEGLRIAIELALPD